MADIQIYCTKEIENYKVDIAKDVRPQVQKIAKKYGANVKIVEVPPGPRYCQH
jgi:hypothetical protein